MTTPVNKQAYAVSTGTAKISAYVFSDSDPGQSNINHDLYTGWVNTVTKALWYLEALNHTGGNTTAVWRAVGPIIVAQTNPTANDYQYPIGQTWVNQTAQTYWALVDIAGTTATWEELSSGATTGLLSLTGDSGGAVSGDGARNIDLVGTAGQISVTGNPATNTLTLSFTGSPKTETFAVDASTPPGTNPVTADVSGEVTVTGADIAAAGVPVRTNSLAANTYTIEVQRSATAASADATKNGLCHFDSAHFTVDADGFVSGSGAGGGISVLNVQSFSTSGTYTPTSGMVYALVQMVGAGGGAGGASVDGGDTAPCSSGGGGGMYAQRLLDAATIGASQSVTIGAAGTGGSGQADGVDGGSTSFGAILTVAGGVKGLYLRSGNAVQEGGDGGSAITGTADYSQPGGGAGYAISSGSLIVSGAGGSSYFSSGGKAKAVTSDGETAGGYGGGGSGAVAVAGTPGDGGDGSPGFVLITEYII